MTLRELYDLAKQRQRAADLALAEADGRQACPAEIARLRFELDQATAERRAAFTAFMNSDEQ